MPDTLFSLAFLIVLVMPGVIFSIQVDNRLPVRDLSPLRELATIAGIGALCDAASFALFIIIRAITPSNTPDVGSIEQHGMLYARMHFVMVGWWSIGLFGVSCTLAYFLGKYRPQIAGRIPSGRIRFASAWWTAFHDHKHDNAYIYLGCELQDGSYVAGFLENYSTETDETPDRELILSEPLSYRPPGEKSIEEEMENVSAVILSASQLKFVTVTYTYVDPRQKLDNAPDIGN